MEIVGRSDKGIPKAKESDSEEMAEEQRNKIKKKI